MLGESKKLADKYKLLKKTSLKKDSTDLKEKLRNFTSELN